MKQSNSPLIITVEQGVFIGARSKTHPLVAGVDFVLLDLAKTFTCTKCNLTWPMEKAVIDSNERPLCPLCAGRWTYPEEVKA